MLYIIKIMVSNPDLKIYLYARNPDLDIIMLLQLYIKKQLWSIARVEVETQKTYINCQKFY